MGRSLAGNEEITPQELAIKIKTNADTNKTIYDRSFRSSTRT